MQNFQSFAIISLSRLKFFLKMQVLLLINWFLQNSEFCIFEKKTQNSKLVLFRDFFLAKVLESKAAFWSFFQKPLKSRIFAKIAKKRTIRRLDSVNPLLKIRIASVLRHVAEQFYYFLEKKMEKSTFWEKTVFFTYFVTLKW